MTFLFYWTCVSLLMFPLCAILDLLVMFISKLNILDSARQFDLEEAHAAHTQSMMAFARQLNVEAEMVAIKEELASIKKSQQKLSVMLVTQQVENTLLKIELEAIQLMNKPNKEYKHSKAYVLANPMDVPEPKSIIFNSGEAYA